MPTLGTQTISSSYAQLLKTFTTGGIDGSLQVITDGDDTSSALSLSTTGVKSTGSFAVDGASTLTGLVTFGTSLTASNGTATIGTLFTSGPATFGTNITASTGTATLGTINVNSATIGTTKFGASGPSLVAVTYATATYSGGTLQDIDHVTGGSNSSTGTFSAAGVINGDIVIGSINSIGSTTGITPSRLFQDFRVESPNVIRFTILNTDQTSGTIPAGIVSATAMRFTA